MRTKTERTTTSFRFSNSFRDSLRAASRTAGMSQTEMLEHCFRQCHPVAGEVTDTQMIDWLADVKNERGQVSLPRECVLVHPHSMRDAIRAAMEMPAYAPKEVAFE